MFGPGERRGAGGGGGGGAGTTSVLGDVVEAVASPE